MLSSASGRDIPGDMLVWLKLGLLHLFGNFFEDCDEEHVGFADVDLSCSFLSWPLH